MTSCRGMIWSALLLTLMVSLFGVTGSAHAAVRNDQVLLPVDDTEILILEVLVNRHVVSTGTMGYRHGDMTLLPLGELAAAMEMAITVDPYTGTAEGWINEESNTFRLDVGSATVTFGGQSEVIAEPCVYIDPDDIFVDAALLGRWWKVDAEVDLRGMRATLVPRDRIPLVSRLEREQSWENIGRGRRRIESFPRRKGQYRTLSWPFLDATVIYDQNRTRSILKGSLLSRNDVAHMSMTGFVGYSEESENEWIGWLRAERSDPEGGLLGPLGATRVQLGDVVGEASRFVKGTTRGRGVMLSNRPVGSVTEFGATDVTGDAPPGWEAELYRDGYLHAIQTVDESGAYLFESIPVHPGLNTMRVVLYGPNGQTREEMRTVNIASSMWRPGQFTYEMLSHQGGESVVGTPTDLNPTQDVGYWVHSLALGYGLRQGTSLDMSAARRYAEAGHNDYIQGRILQSIDRVLLEGRTVHDLGGGDVMSLSAQTRVAGQSLLLSHSLFNEFESTDSQYERELRQRSEVRLSGTVRRDRSNLMNYRLDWQGSGYDGESTRRRDLVRLYLGRSVGRFQVSHDLDYSRTESTNGTSDVLTGRLQTSGFLRGVRLRFDTDYDLTDDPGLNAVGAGLNWNLSSDFSAQLSAHRMLRGAPKTTIQGNLDWHLDPVRLGFRAGYDTESEHFFGVSATTSLARAPRSGWRLSSRTTSQQGAAQAQTFIDLNGNGVYDTDDEPMSGVSFGRNPLWSNIRTDEEGVAFLPGLPADRFVNVLVNIDSVDDPYLVTENEGLTTLVHAGGVAKLSFPFQMVGEIEGLVLTSPGMRPLRNVGLELLDGAGNRVASAVSEFDGFYLFDKVKPGTYQIRVVMTTLREGLYHEPPPAEIYVPDTGDYIEGPTVVLERIGGMADEEPVVATVEPELGPAVTEPVDVAMAGSGEGQGGSGGAGGAGGSGGSGGAGAGAGGGTGGSGAVADAGVGESGRGATTAPVQVAAATTRPEPAQLEPSQGPIADPDVNRTLHLIHELLFQSPLFSE